MPAFLKDSVEWYANERLAEIDRLRARRFLDGFMYNGYLIDGDSNSIQNINGAATLALASIISQQPWPADYKWITYDNTQMALATAPEVIAFGQAAAIFVTQVVFVARAHKDALLAMTSELNTVQDVLLYDITIGWP